jgi:hypothetical protein
MTFPDPSPRTHETADAQRDETKRQESPCSFFFAQGKSLVLASQYFNDERLVDHARGGVAGKHRHRNSLALYGQMMAAFEYMLKDFIAKVIDSSGAFDEKIQKCKWIEVDAGRVLASRTVAATPGSILIHPTMGWHYPETVNTRYQELFSHQAIYASEISKLKKLWILRHSVAHNAGFVTHHDASRLGIPALSERMVEIDGEFISGAFDFLCPIAERVASIIGDKILLSWLSTLVPLGPSFTRDEEAYIRIKKLASYVGSRTQELPAFTDADYSADFARAPA